LQLALLLIGVDRDDEVIIPTYVCDDVLSAVRQVGAKPVLADITDTDFNIDIADVRKRMTRNTKAIVIVHMFGMPACIDQFLDLGVSVIEDCAHSIGAVYKEKLAGTRGDLAILSFHALKMLTTGEGGMVVTDSDQLSRRKRQFDHPDFAGGQFALHFHLSNILSALGIAQLQRFSDRLRRRRSIAELYSKSLATISGARLPILADGDRESACFRYCLLLNEGLHFAELEKAFMGEQVVVRRPVKRLLHRMLEANPELYPVAESCFDRIVSIPLFPDLTEDEVEAVIKAVRKILE